MTGLQLALMVKACGFTRDAAETIFAGGNAIAYMEAIAQEDRPVPGEIQKSVDSFRFGMGQSLANLQQGLQPKEDGQVIVPVLVQYSNVGERPPDMNQHQAEFVNALVGFSLVMLPLVRVVPFDKAKFQRWFDSLIVPMKDGMVAREHWARSTLESRIVVPGTGEMPLGAPVVAQ